MKLRFAARVFDGFRASLAAQVAHFREQHPDIEVDADFYDVEALYELLKSPDHGYDVAMCLTDWMPEMIQDQVFTPLNPLMRKSPVQDWPDGWVNSLRRLQEDEGGNVYGIAYHDGPVMFYYRKDLFEDPSEQTRFMQTYGYPLAPPVNWDQFVDVATFFTRPESGLFGTVIGAYPDGHNNVYDFILQLWSRGGDLFDSNGTPAFDSEIGVESLRYLVDLIHTHRVVPPNVFELDSVAAGDYYYSTRNVAMAWNWSHIAACAEIPDISTIVGKNAWTVLPKGSNDQGRHTSIIAYYINGVLSQSRNQDQAYELVRTLAQPEMDKITTFEGGIGTRLSTWRDPEVLRKFPFYENIERIHNYIQSTPAIVEYPLINEVLNRAIDDALNLRGDISTILKNAVNETKNILGLNEHAR